MIRKVLFVDDDQILRAAIEQRLGSYNDRFHLVTAVDGFDAVGKLKAHPVSLVVLDLVMPRMDGMSLIDHLKHYYPDLPIIVASGIGDEKVFEVARNSSAFGYLNKPFQADDLVTMIEEVLGKEAAGGIMNEVSPPVFMQLMEMDARTCTIRMLDNLSDRGGILHFNQGELYDARVGEVSGLDAAHQIFSWDRTTIFISNECSITENRINASLGSIIMKAVGMKDESDEHPEDYDERESIASLSNGDTYGDDTDEPIGSENSGGPGGTLSLEALKKELEGFDTIEMISGDARYQKVVDQLSRLGNSSGYGKLVMATISEGRNSSRMIVPTQPTGVIRAASSVSSQLEIAVQQKLQEKK